MSPGEFCEEHTKISVELAKNTQAQIDQRNSWEEIKIRLIAHINEGEKQGGVRDRLLILEQEVSALKKAMWVRVMVSGLIGGLIGSGSADALSLFLKWLMKG